MNILLLYIDVHFLSWIQAKMGMTEEFETSLQVLRGFDTDISIEVNEIKVTATSSWVSVFTLSISFKVITPSTYTLSSYNSRII